LAVAIPDEALPQARAAAQQWSGLQAPYEVARAKVLVGAVVSGCSATRTPLPPS
jgi:hypothetical protein